jgi:ABC-2 type transport system permease protein
VTSPSPWRAWFYLIWLCLVRQARAHQLVWIALVLLGLTTAVVGLNTLGGRWTMNHWRFPRGGGGSSLAVWVEGMGPLPGPLPAVAIQTAFKGAGRGILNQAGFSIFSTWVVFSVFLSFLLPIWSLSFATNAIGGEREARTLGWLLNQPLPRPAIYLAKFIGILPYSLGFNLGGFALLCLAGGRAAQPAFSLYWPGVVCSTLAFSALFHLMGAWFRRPAVIALVYSFFLETILGNMPGTMKRISIGFFTRCMMFDEAQEYGVQPEKPSIYLPVDGLTAEGVLIGITALMLGIGVLVFSRSEYHDLN